MQNADKKAFCHGRILPAHRSRKPSDKPRGCSSGPIILKSSIRSWHMAGHGTIQPVDQTANANSLVFAFKSIQTRALQTMRSSNSTNGSWTINEP